ncbi:MAG: ABC transporter substrate-binding protein [Pseudomonadota bacterium]
MMSMPTSTNRRGILKGALAGSFALSAPAIVKAQAPVTLRLSSWLPPASLITQNLFVLWADEISNLTNGRVAVEFLPQPLGPPPAHKDLVQSNAADIVYSLHGYTSDNFLRARIGQFSGLGDAYSASHAFARVYGQLLDAEDEHPDMTLLGLFQHGPGVLMLKDKVIRGPEDFQGLRVRTAGGFIGSLMDDLGAINVPMSPIAVRQALIDGDIDGVAFPYEAGPAFGVVDQITFISEFPGGYYNATWFLSLSQQATASVDPDDLALIKAYSSDTVHALAAKAFDYADYLGREEFVAAGVPIEETSGELGDRIASVGTEYEAEWSAELASEGFDGERALAFTRRMTSGR